MAIARVTVWSSGQVLTASALNGEFNNVIDNALSLISPLTANLDVNGFKLLNVALGTVGAPSVSFNSDSDTGLYSPAANTVSVAAGGVQSARFETATTGVNYFDFTPSATTVALNLAAAGSDTNIGFNLATKGTGAFQLLAGSAVIAKVTPGATPVNYFDHSSSATGVALTVIATGTDTNIGITQQAKGTGNHIIETLGAGNVVLRANSTNMVTVTSSTSVNMGTNIPIIPAAVSGTPLQHAIHQENTVKGWVMAGLTGNIIDSYNVTSLTDVGTGQLRVTWDRDFATANYVVVGNATGVSAGPQLRPVVVDTTNAQAAGAVDVYCPNQTPALVDPSANWFILAIGDQ